ncbi:nitrogen regulation protein NR(II) [Paenibacillus wulumuqiensis]|uniref:PAS domain-containing protein n=1 Tax=Paenibacillus wulumuqiensis TaxID=1567107 RepID=UPI000619317F|nr:PAS domain-containing protein [Paenibacillus wulumuqiensis]
MAEQPEQIFCGYMSLSSDHHITAANEKLLLLLGYNQNGLYGCHFESILTRASRLFYQMYFIPHIRLNAHIEAIQLAIKSGNDTEIPFLINARLRERAGMPVYELILLPINQDIDHQEQIQLLRLEAKRLQSKLGIMKDHIASSTDHQDEMTQQIDLQEQTLELMESYAKRSKRD